MFVHYRTLGIILKKEDRGETDQVFTIFTKNFGKLKILGRAIRKIKSKLRAGTQIFYLSEVEFIQGKSYKTLTDVIKINKFDNLREDFKKLKIGYKIAEILDDLFKGEEADEKIWSSILETFRKLNDYSLSYSSLIYYHFAWNLFSFLGYKPSLNHCAVCQKRLTPTNLYFNPEQGGIICNQCFKKVKKGEKISIETIKILRVLFEKNWRFLSKLKIKPEYQKDLKKVSENYLSYLYSALDIS